MKRHRVPSFTASANEIATLVAWYRASGLGLKAFALEAGLPPGRLHYWIYRQPARVSARRRAPPPPPTEAAVFQEVQLPAPPEWGGRWAIEIGLPGGLAVRFSAPASAAWIGAVVHALQRPC